MSRASEDLLGQLHGLIAEGFIEKFKSGEATSADYNAAIKFLKDNGINCVGHADESMNELIDKIEVFPIEGTGKNRTQRLVIHYRFVGCIDLPSIVPKHTYKLDSRQGVAIEYLPSAV